MFTSTRQRDIKPLKRGPTTNDTTEHGAETSMLRRGRRWTYAERCWTTEAMIPGSALQRLSNRQRRIRTMKCENDMKEILAD
jgi:hypothetical protein